MTTLGSQAWAADKGKGKPPGNNGTVKIDGVALGPGKGNEPHVDCEFAVEFYNYEKGDLTATVTFSLQAPTRRPDVKKDGQVLLTDSVAIGEDPAGGGNDLDASELYELSFDGVEPHPQQGYHVKLTVNAPRSRGPDVKHKVFWTRCAPATVAETSTTTTTTAPAVVAPATVTTPTTAPTQVLGVQETRPAVLVELPRTGAGLSLLLFLGGLSLAVSGLTILVASTGPRPLRLG